MGDLDGRTYLVTGASTGIGKETARDLAQRGGRLFLANRSEAKTVPVIDELVAETGNKAIEFIPLDLADLASVRAGAAAFLERDEPLHGLVNNAGIAGQRGLTADGFELAFGTNHIGHFLFTALLLDRIVQSGPARIVTVSSQSHYDAKGIDFDAVRQPTRSVTGLPEYAVSKLANVLFSQELARRLAGTGVTTYALHPGVIASDVWRRVPWPFRSVMKVFMKSTAEGARTSIHCATSPAVAGESGHYYDAETRKEPSWYATEELAEDLWARSVEWTAA